MQLHHLLVLLLHAALFELVITLLVGFGFLAWQIEVHFPSFVVFLSSFLSFSFLVNFLL